MPSETPPIPPSGLPEQGGSTEEVPPLPPDAAATPAELRRRKVPWVVGVVAALLAAGFVVAIMLDTRSDPPRATENTGRVIGGATVQRRDLVLTDTESGTLSYADPQTVYDRLSGTITWLPRVGQLIKRGQALFEVDDKPVILLYGSRPAYRDLGPSDGSGPDIRELNANLVSLGYSAYGIVVDDSWQTATTNAVKALQKSLGEKQTGKIALGQVVFLPGEQLINTIGGTVGSPASGPVGSGSGGAAILQTSSTRLVVTVDLAASSQSEAVVGSHVTVEMPNNSSTVGGTIAAVSPVANSSGSSSGSAAGGSSGSSADSSSGSGAGSSATVPVTITLDKRVKGAGLDQAPVSVDFAQAKAKQVLSVPVTALVVSSGARYAVQEASAPHKLIPVSTGLFAAGYVQISGPGIHPRLRVTDSQG